MEYGILGAVIVAVVYAFFKSPKKFKSFASKNVIKKLRTNKEEITEAIYKKVPSEVKVRLGSNILKYLISTFLEIIISILEDEVKKPAKK